jgi:hypothetical protein
VFTFARLKTLRHRIATAAQLLLVAAVLWYAWGSVKQNWAEIRDTTQSLQPHWGLIVASALIVFSAYLLLIENWRRLMRDWGTQASYMDSMRIWFVSVLGRYIPGRYWSVVAVGVMAKRANIDPLIAVGSALLLTLTNTVVGGSILMGIGGPSLLTRSFGLSESSANAWIPPALIIASLAVLLSLPLFLGPLARFLSRVTRRNLHLPQLSWMSVFRSAAGCAGAWLLYGVAFRVFCLGLFGNTGGSLMDYVTVYTGSYLVGYVAVFAPGGFGAREVAMQTLLPGFGLLDTAHAVVAAWSSRIWLTVLEVLPGVVLMWVKPRHGVAGTEVEQKGASTGRHPVDV